MPTCRKFDSVLLLGITSTCLILFLSPKRDPSLLPWAAADMPLREVNERGKVELYEGGNWSSLWWLPEVAKSPRQGVQVAIEGAAKLPHLIFVPASTAPPGGWPLLVFLHGQGESSGASSLARVALQGPPQQAGRNPESMRFVVLSPQKPIHEQFFSNGVAEGIMGLIDSYAEELNIDLTRVYLTGLSQGGIGTWGLASDPRFSHRFAAIAPVCGGLVGVPDMKQRAASLQDTPIWAFHGENDSILPVSLSDSTVSSLNSTSRTAPLKYTRLAEARAQDYAWEAAGIPPMEGHASWVQAYYPPRSKIDEQPLYDWLLSHTRPQTS